uniref:Dihydrolipoamide acetyltransferase component of pyruvate dehydrogenase complex n=1 Tax=Naegleria gruberi TaxID=5762 RepID=D0E7R6_NAEGR|nr:transacylase [Naegleria gruberi]
MVINKKVNNFGSCLLMKSGAASVTATTTMRNYHTTNSNKKVVPFLLADIGEGITKVEVVKWFIKEGDHIEQFQNVAEVMSDKANVEISSRFDGVVKRLCYNVGDIANVGAPLIEIEVADSTASPSSAGAATSSSSTVEVAKTTSTPSCAASSDIAEESFGKILTTPAVRRIARENNLDLTKVPATGRNGRVLKEDVLSYLENPTKQQSEKVAVPEQTSTATTTTSTPSTPTVGDRREPVRGLMRTMIRTMNAATKVPHFGYKDEVYVDNLMIIRSHLKKTAERQGVKLSYMPFIIKAVSLALKEYPILNSSLTEDESEIIYKGDHNIGVAMDTPNGLLVPNIKSVQNKSILEIAAELNRLQELGKQGKLGANDLKGGTFTLSNIGTIGGTYADPVLSIPEVCIGAIGMIKKTATFDAHNNVVPKHIMYMSWAADHRVVDGATMARFSNLWKEYLENPDNFIVALK